MKNTDDNNVLNSILANLERATGVDPIPCGSGWQASCPIHDDERPSLSINLGDDGRILLFCHAGCKTEKIVEALGMEMNNLFPSGNGSSGTGTKLVAAYDYVDANGELLYQSLRYEPKDFRQRKPDGKGGYEYKLGNVRRVLYRLPQLLDSPPSEWVFIVEGEKDANALAALGLVATTNAMGAGKWRKEYSESLRERKVVLLPDNDDAGEKHAQSVGASLAGVAAETRILKLPGLLPKSDVSDWLTAGGTKEELRKMALDAPLWEPKAESGRSSPPRNNASQATALVDLARNMELYVDGTDQAFARIAIGGHFENWEIGGDGFRRILSHLYWEEYRTVPRDQALKDAEALLQAKAVYEGEKHLVYVRVARLDDAIYLDLVNDDWQAIEIKAGEWKVINDPPARFYRTPGMQELPCPVRNGSLNELKKFLNLPNREAWILIAGWLVCAIGTGGAIPMLVLNGEQGSAKSTTASMLRGLIDPNEAALRALPSSEEHLAIMARNGWIMCFDNLSKLSDNLSDALCRVATGSGVSKRKLYTDFNEALVKAKRPILLNGIEDLATRGDLLSRSIMVTLMPLDPEDRRSEGQLRRDYKEALPRILGGYLTVLSSALANFGKVELGELPRMADAAIWVAAAEQALGFEEGDFARVYRENIADSNQVALESCPFFGALNLLLRIEWHGTAEQLLNALRETAKDHKLSTKAWPDNAYQMGGRLRRIAGNLLQIGLEVEFERENSRERRRMITIRRLPDPNAFNFKDAIEDLSLFLDN